jgi:6-pyruvoyltetrahydropterin/6-carboxytetrahydropterin synthase
MYVVSVQAHYDSAHFLRNYKGKCEKLHGHRYVVEVALMSDELNAAGLAFDFVDVKRHTRELADWLDHENINELPPFDEVEPSAENQARFFFDELKQRLPSNMAAALLYTKVWETPTQFALYSEKTLAF